MSWQSILYQQINHSWMCQCENLRVKPCDLLGSFTHATSEWPRRKTLTRATATSLGRDVIPTQEQSMSLSNTHHTRHCHSNLITTLLYLKSINKNFLKGQHCGLMVKPPPASPPTTLESAWNPLGPGPQWQPEPCGLRCSPHESSWECSRRLLKHWPLPPQREVCWGRRLLASLVAAKPADIQPVPLCTCPSLSLLLSNKHNKPLKQF